MIKALLRTLRICILIAFYTIPLQSRAVENGFGLHITSLGQSYIEKEFSKTLLESGYLSNQVFLPSVKYELSEQRSTEFLLAIGVHSSILKFRSVLDDYFGISTQKHRVHFETKGINLSVSWGEPQLRFYPVMKESESIDSAVIAAKMRWEVRELSASSTRLIVSDSANPVLGKVEFMNPQLYFYQSAEPIYVEVDFIIGQRVVGEFFAEVNEVSSNLNTVNVEFDFDAQILFPQIQLGISSKKYASNSKKWEGWLASNKKILSRRIKVELEKYISDEGVGLIESALDQKVRSGYEEFSSLTPPHYGENAAEAEFEWFSQLKSIDRINEVVGLGFAVEVIDPYSYDVDEVSMNPMYVAKSNLKKDVVDDPFVPFWITINQGVLNKSLGLSFRRGFLKDLNEDIKLLKQPVLNLSERKSELQNYTHKPSTVTLVIEKEVPGINSLFSSKLLQVEFDIEGEFFVESSSGEVKFRFGKLVESSVYVNMESFLLFKASIKEKVLKQIVEKTKQFVGKELKQHIVLPPKIFGVKVKSKSVLVDGNGYLVVKMEAVE